MHPSPNPIYSLRKHSSTHLCKATAHTLPKLFHLGKWLLSSRAPLCIRNRSLLCGPLHFWPWIASICRLSCKNKCHCPSPERQQSLLSLPRFAGPISVPTELLGQAWLWARGGNVVVLQHHMRQVLVHYLELHCESTQARPLSLQTGAAGAGHRLSLTECQPHPMNPLFRNSMLAAALCLGTHHSPVRAGSVRASLWLPLSCLLGLSPQSTWP